MGAKASDIVKLAQSWVGLNEADGSHKAIIDTYNSHTPLARGYKVRCIANGDARNDAWCATTISALAIKLGATDIIPTECGCGEMIKLCQQKGIFVADKKRVPNAAEIIFYDWGGDGWADHVGIVESVAGNIITVIEGNYKKAVSRRTIGVGAINIRGYAVPEYDPEEVSFIHDGLDYSVLFDPVYYSNRYTDLQKAFGSDSFKLFNHFIKYGMKEARQACETFDVAFYKASYKDLQEAYGEDLPAYYRHYVKYGHKEGRKTIQTYTVQVGPLTDKAKVDVLVADLEKLGYEVKIV